MPFSFKNMNRVTLVGSVGDTPALKNTGGSSHLVTFQIATNEYWTDKSGQKQHKAEWHRIVVWGKLGDSCLQHISKGSLVMIEGKLRHKQWTDKQGNTRNGADIEANNIIVLADSDNAKANVVSESVNDNEISPDDLPF